MWTNSHALCRTAGGKTSVLILRLSFWNKFFVIDLQGICCQNEHLNGLFYIYKRSSKDNFVILSKWLIV